MSFHSDQPEQMALFGPPPAPVGLTLVDIYDPTFSLKVQRNIDGTATLLAVISAGDPAEMHSDDKVIGIDLDSDQVRELSDYLRRVPSCVVE